MINSRLSHSYINFPECNHNRLVCAKQFRCGYSDNYNRMKWQSICLFIIILLTIQGFCNLVSFKIGAQLCTSNITIKVDKGVPRYSSEWRESRDSSAPPKNLRICLYKIDAIKIASDTGCRQFAFYQNTINPAIQNS